MLISSLFVALSADAQIAQGELTIISSCQNGQKDGSNGECLNDVKFYEKRAIPQAEIDKLLKQNNWRMASPTEVEAAWKFLNLHQVNFGKMSDGNYAVPMQSDGPILKRGLNLRDSGVSMFSNGFFYVDAAEPTPKTTASVETKTEDIILGTVTISNQAPKPAPKTAPPAPQNNNSGGTIRLSGEAPIEAFEVKDGDPKPVQYFADLAADSCADPGNLMIDGWTRAERPILEAAGHKFIAKKGYGYSSPNLSHVVNKLKADPKLRWEFAPLMIESAWGALVAPNPSAGQVAFKQRFEQWAACDKNLTARRALASWNLHIGKWGASNNIGNGVYITWLDPNPEYKPALWSIANKKGPSIYGFDVTNDGNSLYIGRKGRFTLGQLIAPLQARYTPGFDDLADVQYIREDFAAATAGIAAGASALFGAGLGVSVSAVPVSHEIFKIKFAKEANEKIKAKDLEDLKRQANKGAKKVKSAAKAAAKSGKKGAQAALKSSKGILRNAIKNAFSKAASKAGSKVGSKAAQQIGTKVGVQVGTKAGGTAAGVLAIVVIAAATFGEELAEIIQTKLYEDALTYDARNVTEYDVSAILGPEPSELNKMAVFSLLLKMTIAEPADRNTLSLELPIFDCPIGFSRMNETCTVNVGFHGQEGLSLAQATKIASENGWRLATPVEVELAWSTQALDTYAFGLMSDGKFAVPVQKDYSNFKKGSNIGAVGGNQGFFYVHDFVNNNTAVGGGTFIQNAKNLTLFLSNQNTNSFHQMDKPGASWKIIEHGNYSRLQNVKVPNQFAYVNKGKLAYGPVDAASSLGHWNIESEDGLMFQIESVALPHRYIHTENGKIELGYTEPNWKGTLWSIPGY